MLKTQSQKGTKSHNHNQLSQSQIEILRGPEFDIKQRGLLIKKA